MATKVTSKNLNGSNYGIIQRGASFTLPVQVKDEYDNPIDLSGLTVEFTVKKVQTDFDRHDDKAYIVKSFLPQDPVNGKFYVMLSSDDTDFETGKFYFDVELVNEENGMVTRLFTCDFTLDGGPTNRRVNKGLGQWTTGDTITVLALSEGDPIIVIAPTVNLDGDVFGQLAGLMEAVDTCQTQIVDCQQLTQTLQEDLVKVDERVLALEGELTEVKESYDALKEHIDFHDGLLTQITENLELISTILQTQGSEIVNLHALVQENTTNIEELFSMYQEIKDH